MTAVEEQPAGRGPKPIVPPQARPNQGKNGTHKQCLLHGSIRAHDLALKPNHKLASFHGNSGSEEGSAQGCLELGVYGR